jgi:hypothetical protein
MTNTNVRIFGRLRIETTEVMAGPTGRRLLRAWTQRESTLAGLEPAEICTAVRHARVSRQDANARVASTGRRGGLRLETAPKALALRADSCLE